MIYALHKKWSFPLRISSVNVTKSTGNWKLYFLCSDVTFNILNHYISLLCYYIAIKSIYSIWYELLWYMNINESYELLYSDRIILMWILNYLHKKIVNSIIVTELFSLFSYRSYPTLSFIFFLWIEPMFKKLFILATVIPIIF